jgi:hypothetical protein
LKAFEEAKKPTFFSLDSIGLMVCCDDCEVWQHCECMGLEEEDIPDQYFCEQCRPEDHVQIKGYDK